MSRQRSRMVNTPLWRITASPLARNVAAWASLAVAALAVLWPLGLTNRVLAGVDAFTYFEPYWAYRTAALRAGHLPFWNPFLFTGVPFLANPQAAVLYPLHWILLWLPAERALIWSAVLHVWLAAGLFYAFARRSLGVGRGAAWLGGVLFGLGGYTLARVENINQLNAMAWLPAMLWLYDETVRASDWRRRARPGVALAVAIALQLLAGHTQTAFINLVGLSLVAAYPPVKRLLAVGRTARRTGAAAQDGPGGTAEEPAHSPPRGLARQLLPLIAIPLGALLAAAQLLPSAELSRHGLRAGGLPYRQAVSFSLQPRLLLQTFLPPFGGGLAETFGSEGYAEFVAYIGVSGLALALLAVAGLIRRTDAGGRALSAAKAADSAGGGGPAATTPGTLVLLALTGIFLAAGAYNPFYYLLWRFVPGFDLFRAPVRWLELYSLGMAGLAAIGLAGWRARPRTALQGGGEGGDPAAGGRPASAGRRRGRLVAAALGLVGLVALLALQQWPAPPVVLTWCALGLVVAILFVAGRRWPGPTRVLLILMALAEMWVASRALPFTLATAPYVASLRTAPAALLARMAGAPPAGRDRLLSMSDIRYDPGDLAELRALQADRLPTDAVERMVRGAKQTEVIAPNLSLRLQIPTLDGYDGGLLPTADYGLLQMLFLPEDQRLPDGRLREQLRQVPPDRLLDLTGVRFVLTDKQNDLWADDVYYDLEQEARLVPGQALELDLRDAPRFSATGLGLVSYLDGEAPAGSVVAQVRVRDASGATCEVPIRAGIGTATGAGPAGPARVARAWPDWAGAAGHDYLARAECPVRLTPSAISVAVPRDAPAALVLRGLSLVDSRTGAHASVTVSQRGNYRRIHSGDVKVYERVGAPGRAWLVHGVQPAGDEAEALRHLGNPAFDPRSAVVINGPVTSRPAGAAEAGEGVTIEAFEAERILLEVSVLRPAVLVLADAFYPGWRATVDGEPVPIWRANLMFRGVMLEPGRHQVAFEYEPRAWRLGLALSLATLAALGGALAATWPRRAARAVA